MITTPVRGAEPSGFFDRPEPEGSTRTCEAAAGIHRRAVAATIRSPEVHTGRPIERAMDSARRYRGDPAILFAGARQAGT